MNRTGEIRQLEHAVMADLIGALLAFEGRLTETVESLRGMSLNHELFSGTVVLDANGTYTQDWPVVMASVTVSNFTSGQVTVTNSPPQATAPLGIGSQLVSAGLARTVSLAGRTLTLYGPAGGQVGLTVFTEPQADRFGTVSGSASTSIAGANTATRSSVASSAAVVPLLAANPVRKGGLIYNESTQVLYVILGAGGSNVDYSTQLAPQGLFELPPTSIYTGLINGVWAAANGFARITELT